MIGVFDSGLGGLSVLAAIADALPTADLVYFADSANLPYGDKSESFIRRRVVEIGKLLAERGCSTIVVACNTATVSAVKDLREALPDIAFVGVEPGIKPAAESTKSGRIAVLTTPATANSARLSRLINEHAEKINVEVDILPCPGWATQVEKLQIDDPLFLDSVQQQLEATLDAGSDRVVLGCTHYSFLAPILTPIVEPRATLVDVADAVARQCARLVENSIDGSGKLTLLASSRAERLESALSPLGLERLKPRLAEPPFPALEMG